MRSVAVFLCLFVAIAHAATPESATFAPTIENKTRPPGSGPEGMVWIPGGEFSMGAALNEFIVDAPKPGSGGKCALYVDGQKVAQGHIPKTQPYAFSADEGTDVGMDAETAVSNDYKQGDNKFTGKIFKVTIDTKPSNLSAADKKTVEQAEELAATIED